MSARDAGFRYVLLVTKHHDGFCLWDSKLTDYDVASSGDRTDVVKAVADACQKPLPTNGEYLPLKATATSTWGSDIDEFSADKLCDGGMQTRWASSDLTPTVELELEPGATFDKLTIFEYCDTEPIDNISQRRRNRIEAFNVECLADGKWETIHVSDSPIGDCGVIRLPSPLKAERIRLNITKASAPPSLYEVSVINTTKK